MSRILMIGPLLLVLLFLEYRKWVTLLQTSEQLMERSGRISPQMVPDFVCRSLWRKNGWFSEDVIVIFSTIFKGKMWKR